MKRTTTMAVLGLAFTLAGCPATDEEQLPVDKVVIVERATQLASLPPNHVLPITKEPGNPTEDAVNTESRPAPNSELPDATNPNPLGVTPPTVPGVAPIPAVPWPTPAPLRETPQPPGSGTTQADK